MIDKLFRKHWGDNHGLIALFLGIVLPLISYLVSNILFRRLSSHLIGISTVFFTVILTLPFLNIVLDKEEKLERQRGHFFQKNENIIDFYLYFMIGAFVFFLLISFLSPKNVFSINDLNSKSSFYDTDDKLISKVSGKSFPSIYSDFDVFVKIIKNNLYVVLITFLLSLLFGSGSIYMIVLNTSLAASSITEFIRSSLINNVFSVVCNIGIFSLHLIPEMLGFLISAIAGGILYLDLKHEKIFSKNFDNISIDSFLLLLLGVFFILLAGITEVFISGKLLKSNYCSINSSFILTIFILFIIGLILLEHYRPRKKKYRRLFHGNKKI